MGGSRPRDLKERAGIKCRRQAAEADRVKKVILAAVDAARRIFAQIIGHCSNESLQRAKQLCRHTLVYAIGFLLRQDERLPGTLDAGKWLLERGRRTAARLIESETVERDRIHLARPLDEVMSFVDLHADAPPIREGPAVEHRVEVKVIVVVAHDHIAPAGEFLAQVVRTYGMLQRKRAHATLIEKVNRHRLRARRRQTIIETARERTARSVAGIVRVLAGLLARHELQNPQRQRIRGRF